MRRRREDANKQLNKSGQQTAGVLSTTTRLQMLIAGFGVEVALAAQKRRHSHSKKCPLPEQHRMAGPPKAIIVNDLKNSHKFTGAKKS